MESRLLLSENMTNKPIYDIVEVKIKNKIQKGIYIDETFYRLLHGWYSEKASENSHIHQYLNHYDKVITVTCVTADKKIPKTGYDDLEYEGIIFKHIESYKHIEIKLYKLQEVNARESAGGNKINK